MNSILIEHLDSSLIENMRQNNELTVKLKVKHLIN